MNGETGAERYTRCRYVTGVQTCGEMISVCFRKPKDNEVVKSMNSTQMLQLMQNEFSSVKVNHSSKVQVGFAMKELGYAHSKVGNVTFYKVVPLIAA